MNLLKTTGVLNPSNIICRMSAQEGNSTADISHTCRYYLPLHFTSFVILMARSILQCCQFNVTACLKLKISPAVGNYIQQYTRNKEIQK